MPSGAEVRKTFGDQRVCEALWSPKVFFCVPKLYVKQKVNERVCVPNKTL